MKKVLLSAPEIAQTIENSISEKAVPFVDAPAFKSQPDGAPGFTWRLGKLTDVRDHAFGRQADLGSMRSVSGVWIDQSDLPRNIKPQDVARALGAERVSIQYPAGSDGARINILSHSRPATEEDRAQWNRFALDKKTDVAGWTASTVIGATVGAAAIGASFALAGPAAVGVAGAVGLIGVWAGTAIGGVSLVGGGAQTLRSLIHLRYARGTEIAVSNKHSDPAAAATAELAVRQDVADIAQGLAPLALSDRLNARRSDRHVADTPASPEVNRRLLLQ